MANQRQPIDLIEIKGKKHLTKAEIEERSETEVKAPADDIRPPAYLSAVQKKEFTKLAEELVRVGIFSNIDCDTLARYITARDQYVKFTKALRKIKNGPDSAHLPTLTTAKLDETERYIALQDKMFKQCQSAARELGLTISSRCKLVVPKKEEPPASKWDKFKCG